MRYSLILTVLMTLFTLQVTASEDKLRIGKDVAMGDSRQVLEQKLTGTCARIRFIENAAPSYPLASVSELHLLCENDETALQGFRKAVFVIADNQFTQMEASGVSGDWVRTQLGEPAGSYIGMDVYQAGTYWFDAAQGRLVWLNDAAKHPNLFTWHHPALTSAPVKAYNDSTQLPGILNFNASLKTLRPEFDQQCKYVKEDVSKRIWLPNKPAEQVQINCFGYEYAGFERKFEAVFGDGKLEVIWILTGKQEEPRIRQQLLADWGTPDWVNAKWEVFAGGRISLRKDKPELLVLSDEMVPLYRQQLEQE